MKLQRPTHNRKKWWIWTASTDFADEVAKSEIFAIKFATEESTSNVCHNFSFLEATIFMSFCF